MIVVPPITIGVSNLTSTNAVDDAVFSLGTTYTSGQARSLDGVRYVCATSYTEPTAALSTALVHPPATATDYWADLGTPLYPIGTGDFGSAITGITWGTSQLFFSEYSPPDRGYIPQWLSSTPYTSSNGYVMYLGSVYIWTGNTASTSSDIPGGANYWVVLSSGVLTNQAPTWNSATAYNPGSYAVYVRYDGVVYRSLGASTNKIPSSSPNEWKAQPENWYMNGIDYGYHYKGAKVPDPLNQSQWYRCKLDHAQTASITLQNTTYWETVQSPTPLEALITPSTSYNWWRTPLSSYELVKVTTANRVYNVGDIFLLWFNKTTTSPLGVYLVKCINTASIGTPIFTDYNNIVLNTYYFSKVSANNLVFNGINMLVSTASPTLSYSYQATNTYFVPTGVDFTHKVYQCLQSYTEPVSSVYNPALHPPSTSPTYWTNTGPVNSMAMFDTAVTTSTTAVGGLRFKVSAGRFTSIGFMGIVGTTITITIREGAGGSTIYTESRLLVSSADNFYGFVFEDLLQTKEAYFYNLPSSPNAEIEVVISGIGTVECGLCVMGNQFYIGQAQYNFSLAVEDRGRHYLDKYNNPVSIERGYSKGIQCNIVSTTKEFNRLVNFFAENIGVLCLWIATPDQSDYISTTTFGRYTRAVPVIVGPSQITAALDIAGNR
jgi:hypothetical protein